MLSLGTDWKWCEDGESIGFLLKKRRNGGGDEIFCCPLGQRGKAKEMGVIVLSFWTEGVKRRWQLHCAFPLNRGRMGEKMGNPFCFLLGQRVNKDEVENPLCFPFVKRGNVGNDGVFLLLRQREMEETMGNPLGLSFGKRENGEE